MRQYLHLPPEIVPTTLKKTTRSEARPARAAARSDGPKGGEDRQQYRRVGQSGGQDKKGDVGAGAADLELVSYIPSVFILITFLNQDIDLNAILGIRQNCFVKPKMALNYLYFEREVRTSVLSIGLPSSMNTFTVKFDFHPFLWNF